MDRITYTLDIGLPNERRVVLEKRPATPDTCYVDDAPFPGWTDLEGFANFCESVWYAMNCAYRREK